MYSQRGLAACTTLTRECTTVCLLHVWKCGHCFRLLFPGLVPHFLGTVPSPRAVCCVHRSTQSPRCHFTDTILSHNTRIHTVSSVVIINIPRAAETQDLTWGSQFNQRLTFLWLWPWQHFSLDHFNTVSRIYFLLLTISNVMYCHSLLYNEQIINCQSVVFDLIFVKVKRFLTQGNAHISG